MAAEFFFAVTSQPVPAKVARKRHRIAREVGGKGCGYVSARMPDGHRAWGYGPNRGHPFDAATAAQIRDAWAAAGV